MDFHPQSSAIGNRHLRAAVRPVGVAICLVALMAMPTAGSLAAPGPSNGSSASLAGSVFAPASPQDQELNLELRGRVDKAITIAVPAFSIIPGAEGEATILHDVLLQDLQRSMVFDIVAPELYPAAEAGDGPPDFAAWRRSGAEALIRAFVRRAGNDIIVEYRLYDVQSGGQIIGKRHSGGVPIAAANAANPALRKLAHLFNDEAVLYYTGIPGVAATKIAYVSERRGPKEIYVMDYDGYGQQRITNDGGLALSPAFSPKGDQIAYVSYRIHDGIPNVDIAMLNQGGGIPPVVGRSEGQDSAPAWAPDGTRIVFSSTRDGEGNANAEIYTMKPDGSDWQRITNNSEIDTSPTFSPNGREVAFISTRAGGQHLYKMSIDGTGVRRLRVEGTQIDSPAWNPNPQISDLIAYAASEGGNRFQIFVYSLTTQRSVMLTRGYGRADSPSWSPDGRQIVFEAQQGDETHIYAMGLDGSQLRRLTNEGNNQSPSWGGR
jgi:TolB protein